MKSIKANLIRVIQRNPGYTNYTALATAIKGKGFSRKAILKAFNEFVPLEEYERKYKKRVIYHLYKLSNPSEEVDF